MQTNYNWRHNRKKASYETYCFQYVKFEHFVPNSDQRFFVCHESSTAHLLECLYMSTWVVRKMETVLLCYWLKRHFERGSPFLFCLRNEMVTTYYTLQEDLPGIDCCTCSTSRGRSIRLSCIEFTSWACAVIPWVYFWSRPCYSMYALTVMEHKGKLNSGAHCSEKCCSQMRMLYL